MWTAVAYFATLILNKALFRSVTPELLPNLFSINRQVYYNENRIILYMQWMTYATKIYKYALCLYIYCFENIFLF